MAENREPHLLDAGRNLRVTAIGLGVNAMLAMVKLITGIVGNSYALIADAVESLADVFGSLVVWSGLRIAQAPPDEKHPYGHGKAEPLAAFIVSIMLIAAGLGIAVQSIRVIIDPGPGPRAFTLWILLLIIIVKESMYHVARRQAKRSASQAVLTDAWHHRSDAITSLAALIGIGVAVIGGWPAADAWAALFAAGVILYNAWRLLWPPMHELMDVEQSHVIDDVRRVALEVAGVEDVEKVLARKSGSRYLVDMHLEVDPEMTVRESHRIAHAVKAEVCRRLPRVMDVLVHIEPHADGQEANRREA